MFFALFFVALFGQLAAAISTYGTGLDASLLPEGAILREIDGNQVVGTRADGLFVFKTNSGRTICSLVRCFRRFEKKGEKFSLPPLEG